MEDRDFVMKQALIDAGHTAFFAAESQSELRFDVNRITRLVKQTRANPAISMSES